MIWIKDMPSIQLPEAQLAEALMGTNKIQSE
jgi:hypothetical protein